MTYRIQYLSFHYSGAYHSDDHEGMLWYLQQGRGNLRYATISTVSQEDIGRLEEEYNGKADSIICVDSGMTTTY